MNLKKLLEYQELDIQLRRVLDTIEKSEDFKKIETAKVKFSAAKKDAEDSEKNAAQLISFFNAGEKHFKDAEKQLAELETSIEKTGDLDALIEQFAKLKARINDLEGKISAGKAEAEGVLNAYLDANERAKKLREIHAKAKERQDELYKSKEPQINELKSKMKAIEPQIDKEMLDKYRAITGEGKYPAFVEAYPVDKAFSCKGCGMKLSQTGMSQLSGKGYCVCETCRRVIYNK